MKVLLLKDVAKIGQRGEVVEVKDGYARNFLVPRGLSKIAAAGDIEEAQARKAKLLLKEEEKKSAQKIYRKKLDGLELRFVSKANDAGVLFASIGAAEVARELHKKDFTLIKREDVLDVPLKNVGEHVIHIRLGKDMAHIRVIIEAS